MNDPDGSKLGYIEQTVYEIITAGRAGSENVSLIASLCSQSELEVKVAIQLLKYKQLI